MMSNMCKPVDPSRSFADVLKEQVFPPLSKSSTSKIQTASKTQVPLKVQVPQVSRQWSPCEQGKSTYAQKLVDPSPYQVPCHNRFAPLTQLKKKQWLIHTKMVITLSFKQVVRSNPRSRQLIVEVSG